MRLTNVAQMDLVPGRVLSYGVVAIGQPGPALTVSFDQRRHVAAGQRPGSWMSIALRVPVHATPEQVAAAWNAVVARHGTLRSAFSLDESGELRLHAVDVAAGVWEQHPAAEAQLTREIVRSVFDAHCASFERPSHRICLVIPEADAPDPRPELMIGSDHAHVDMWSLVVLARELLSCLDDVLSGRAPGATLPDVPAFAEHSAQLAAAGPAPSEVHERWAAILEAGDGKMPTFPLDLGDLDPVPAEVVEVRDVLDVDETAVLSAIARERGVRLIGLGLSVLTEATMRLSGQPLRAIFPVHSRHNERWQEAVGWFITNAVIESSDPDPAACVAAVQEAIGLGSWPLAPILEPLGGMPHEPGLFAVSWLDARRLPAPPEQAIEFKHVSAAIRTDGVMIWFLVNSSGLHLRCRYPETPEARESVGQWLDEIEAGLRAMASP